jgi:hypothetical protein
LKNKDLGYNKDNLVIFSIGSVRKNLDAFRAELLQNPNITHVSGGATPTWGVGGHRFGKSEGDKIEWEGKQDESRALMDMHFADYDYLETFQMKMKEGRWFSREFSNDRNNYVINETAVKSMGLKDPIGTWFSFGDRKGIIIGVTEDIHISTLREKIAPTFFMCVPNLSVAVRIKPTEVRRTLDYIEDVWKKFVPERPINFQFLDDRLAGLYAGDRKLGNIVTNYTLLSLLISCLGLFGLVSFLAEQKTKEIGIRKILGAPVSSIVRIISGEFVPLLLVANLIALPAGYFITSKWLKNFAYNTGFDVWIFLSTMVAVFMLAFITVSYKTLKVAFMNPVDSLRYE